MVFSLLRKEQVADNNNIGSHAVPVAVHVADDINHFFICFLKHLRMPA